MKKKILIVDDHPVLRRGLASLINAEPDLAVCGEASDCRTALEGVRRFKPDLVIADLHLAGGDDGLDLIKSLRKLHSQIPALVLSMHDEADYAVRSLRAGARGYITKQQLDETVLIAIRQLLAGETYMSDNLRARLATKFIGGQTLQTDSSLSLLSDRELQVLNHSRSATIRNKVSQSAKKNPDKDCDCFSKITEEIQ